MISFLSLVRGYIMIYSDLLLRAYMYTVNAEDFSPRMKRFKA